MTNPKTRDLPFERAPIPAIFSGDPRVTVRSNHAAPPGGEFILYWSQIQRRADDNAALAYAVARGNELGVPVLVYESIRPDYPYASDRLHTFALEGARENAKRFAGRGIEYAFFLPKTPDEARGIVRRLAARARLVVSDETPIRFLAEQNDRAAAFSKAPFVTLDDNAVTPLALFPRKEFAARTIRPKVHRALAEWLRPIEAPEPRYHFKQGLDLPFERVTFAPEGASGDAQIAALVAGCAIDHDVPPVAETRGGSAAAEARLAGFLRSKLPGYLSDRNEPSRRGTTGLSPYLHWGMVSARRVALDAERAAHEAAGSREAVDALLEQLLVRRTLAYNFAQRERLHDRYECIPDWAKATLEAHAGDKREYQVSDRQIDEGRTPDEVWNAAQLELRVRGVIHNYTRMLWGKLVLAWATTPRHAFDLLVKFNDKYALDGRDPDGWASIAWCFGVHDRPWPERPVFGKVRSMTSRSTRSKYDLEGYLAEARGWRQRVG